MEANKKIKIINYIFNKGFFKIIKKQKSIFIYSASIFFSISIIYAFFKKPVWQGQFQIVLDETSTSSIDQLSQLNPNITSVLGLGSKANNLKTEVGILGSPSVLLPVFNDYLEKSKTKGIDTKNFRFKSWKNKNLNIYLVPKTSILNLDYKDENKEFILPIISLISKRYQEYSNRDRKNSLKTGLEYINEQVFKYNELSNKSLRKKQAFAITNDLIPFQNNFSSDVINALDLATIRVQAANEIRTINAQLEQIENSVDNFYLVKYLNSILPEFIQKKYVLELDQVEMNLAKLRAKYFEEDIEIQRSLNEKEVLTSLMKSESISFLKGKKSDAIAKLKSTERPEGILVEYREMIREYTRYEQTLVNLEKQLQVLALEQAKALKPWELITNPTLIEEPIGPSKKRIIALSLFASIIAAILISLLFDKLNELIVTE